MLYVVLEMFSSSFSRGVLLWSFGGVFFLSHFLFPLSLISYQVCLNKNCVEFTRKKSEVSTRHQFFKKNKKKKHKKNAPFFVPHPFFSPENRWIFFTVKSKNNVPIFCKSSCKKNACIRNRESF